jgi:hypothetical protein
VRDARPTGDFIKLALRERATRDRRTLHDSLQTTHLSNNQVVYAINKDKHEHMPYSTRENTTTCKALQWKANGL